MPEYLERFESAFFRTALLYGEELNPPTLKSKRTSPYGKDVIDAIVADFKDGVVQNSGELPGHCFRFVRDASYVLFELGIDNTVTIGAVSANGRPQFTTTLASVEQEIQTGFDPSAVANAHAWLTLDTGQVLDPTIIPSWAHFDEGRNVDLDGSIYLSGVSCNVDFAYDPLLTGFAYHMRVVTHPLIRESFERYSSWLKHSGIYKRQLAAKRAA